MNPIEQIINSFVDKQLSQPPTPGAASPVDRSVVKGLIAGLVAGAVATAAKTAAEQFYPPRTEGQPPPPAVLAEKVAGHELTPASKAVATETIHWAFGVAAGGAYGVLAEFYPAATTRGGVNFGMTLMALTHESALPAFGLSASPGDQTSREKTSEMATHIVYGVVAETVRRMVRKAL